MNIEQLFGWLDRLGILLGLLLALPVLWAWGEFSYGRKARQRRWLREVREQPGQRPAILAIDLLTRGRSLHAATERLRAQSEALGSVPDDRFFQVQRDTELSEACLPGLVDELRTTIGAISQSGADVVHLLFAGPGFAAALVGHELANVGCRVILYAHRQGIYMPVGPLCHPGECVPQEASVNYPGSEK